MRGRDKKINEVIKKNPKEFEQEPVAEERTTEDPFGFKKPSVPSEKLPMEGAVRIVKFTMLLVKTFGMTPEQLIFAFELAACNIYNADDLPISSEKRDEIRKKAYEYYKKATS